MFDIFLCMKVTDLVISMTSVQFTYNFILTSVEHLIVLLSEPKHLRFTQQMLAIIEIFNSCL